MAMLTDTNVPFATSTPGILSRIGAFFAALRAASLVARDFEDMQMMSDEALARKGLTRDQISRAVVERHFG